VRRRSLQGKLMRNWRRGSKNANIKFALRDVEMLQATIVELKAKVEALEEELAKQRKVYEDLLVVEANHRGYLECLRENKPK